MPESVNCWMPIPGPAGQLFHADSQPTRTALLPYEPIAFVGKPVLPVVLQRALKKAKGLTEL
jgi:hypothetical protein